MIPSPKKWYVNTMGPIDYFYPLDRSESFELSILPDAVLNAARSLGWDGDVRVESAFIASPGEPERRQACAYRFYVPNPDACAMEEAYIWKQDNNGQCFVVSPVPLDYLSVERPGLVVGGCPGATPIEEKFFDAMLAIGGHNGLHFQYEEPPYKIDFAYPSVRLGIELDGLIGHSTPSDIEKDRKRQRFLEDKGWQFIRFGGREVKHDPFGCAREVLARLERAMAQAHQ